MSTPRPARWLLGGLLFLAPGPLLAQTPLTLGQAFTLADQHAYPNRVALADRDIRAAERERTLRGLLPSLRIEAGWTRTTDPLGAFGAQLRQRTVSPESFSPDRLNDPASLGNLGTALVAEVPLLNPDTWMGRRAGTSVIRSADAAARWTRNRVHLDVVRAYYGGVLAREQVVALEAGLSAARSHVLQAQSLQRQGMVTRSDVLLAEVKTGETETRLIAARGAERLAGKRLAVVLGLPDDTLLTLPETFCDSTFMLAVTAPRAAGSRADLDAARFGVTAARRDVARATAQLLPSVNSFGRVDWNTSDAFFRGHSSWTVGVIARWSVFGGAAELVERNRARVEAVRAEARADAAEAQARLEQEERRTELEVARAGLAIAERSVAQVQEAHRIITRKYEGGLATVTELLEAAALETQTRVERAAAVYRLLTAAAAWQVALGHVLTDFAPVSPGTEVP